MLSLVTGTILAVAALAFVLAPLFATGPVASPRRPRVPSPARTDLAEHDAIVALREIEFDRATGKLSERDYAELTTRYTEQAVAVLRRADGADGIAAADPVERLVSEFRRRIRSCDRCGPRPEPEATYCSACGRYLPGECPGCGGAVQEEGAAFCSGCGRQLAA